MSIEPTLAQRIASVEAWVKKRDTVSEPTVANLARQFNLTAKEVRVIIDRARYKLAANAEAYVEAHMETVQLGLEVGREGGRNAPAGLKVAQDGAAWALERISQGHSRVLDAPKAQGATGPQIVIGIQVGGVRVKNTAEEEPPIEATDVIITSEPPVQDTPNVTITSKRAKSATRNIPEPIEPVRLDLTTAQPVKTKVSERPSYRLEKKNEKKIQAILAAVTEENAQVMTRSLIDLGHSAAFAWELVKAQMEVDSKM